VMSRGPAARGSLARDENLRALVTQASACSFLVLTGFSLSAVFFNGVGFAGRPHKDSDEKPNHRRVDHRFLWSARLRSSRLTFGLSLDKKHLVYLMLHFCALCDI
jgi:hypothetical protein